MARESSSSGIGTGLIVAGAAMLLLMIFAVVALGGFLTFGSSTAPPGVQQPAVAVPADDN